MSDVVKLFISYTHVDRRYRDDLHKHLRHLERQGLTSIWSDTDIRPGDDVEATIRAELNSANIIVLLVSADFLASDFCWYVELQTALARHEAGSARVVAVIIRDCDWRSAPLARLLVLPHDGVPVMAYSQPDKAWTEVAANLRKLIQGESTPPTLETVHWTDDEEPQRPPVGADRRELWRITIEAPYNEVSVRLTAEIAYMLRRLAGDSEITITQMLTGSVIVEFEVSREGGRRLADLHARGQLDTLLGMTVQDIERVGVAEPRGQEAPKPLGTTRLARLAQGGREALGRVRDALIRDPGRSDAPLTAPAQLPVRPAALRPAPRFAEKASLPSVAAVVVTCAALIGVTILFTRSLAWNVSRPPGVVWPTSAVSTSGTETVTTTTPTGTMTPWPASTTPTPASPASEPKRMPFLPIPTAVDGPGVITGTPDAISLAMTPAAAVSARGAITLLGPAPEAVLEDTVVFTWTPIPLEPGEVYDLRVCMGESCTPLHGITNTTDTTWRDCPARGGPGTYRWQVLVIRDSDKAVVGPASEIRTAVWTGDCGRCKRMGVTSSRTVRAGSFPYYQSYTVNEWGCVEYWPTP